MGRTASEPQARGRVPATPGGWQGRVGPVEGAVQVRGVAPPTGSPGHGQARLGDPAASGGPELVASQGPAGTPPHRALLGRARTAPPPGRAPKPRAQPGRSPRGRPLLRAAHSPVADHHALDGLHGRGPGGRGRKPSCGEMPAPQRPRTRAERRAEWPETAERLRAPNAETAERRRLGARAFGRNLDGGGPAAHSPSLPPSPGNPCFG